MVAIANSREPTRVPVCRPRSAKEWSGATPPAGVDPASPVLQKCDLCTLVLQQSPSVRVALSAVQCADAEFETGTGEKRSNRPGPAP